MASDHGGWQLKEHLRVWLTARAHDVMDCGCHDASSVDYPDYVHDACKLLEEHYVDRAIVVCGSGIGASIAANRHPGVRCALVHNEELARLSRQHNNANCIALGGRFMDFEQAQACVLAWLTTPYEGGRHDLRLAKLTPPRA